MGGKPSLPAGAAKLRVVVIGCGFAGYNLLKLLNDYTNLFEVTVIDKKSFWENNMASVRFLVQPDYHSKVVIPDLASLFHGTFVHGEALQLRANEVVVKQHGSGEETTVAFDYAVICTGSNYSNVFKADSHATQAERFKSISETAASIASAEHVLVVGGGATGVELAAEIRDAHPEKKVTLVHAGPHVVPGWPQAAYQLVQDRLQAVGVNVLLNTRVMDSVGSSHRLSTGESINALKIVAYGSAPQTAWLKGSSLVPLTENGDIRVHPTLQVEGSSTIFALGDACNLPGKMAFNTYEQTIALAKSLVALATAADKSQARLTSVRLNKLLNAAGLVTMGPQYGVMNFGLLLKGAFVAKIKDSANVKKLPQPVR